MERVGEIWVARARGQEGEAELCLLDTKYLYGYLICISYIYIYQVTFFYSMISSMISILPLVTLLYTFSTILLQALAPVSFPDVSFWLWPSSWQQIANLVPGC